MSLTLRSGPPVRRAAAFASGLVVLAAAGCSEILGHDGPSVGDVLWRQAVVTVPHHWFGLPATDGDRVFFDVGNSVKAFDLESGHEQWSTPIRERLTAESQGIVHHGSLIVVVAEQRDIIAMDARTGQIRWRTRVDTSLNQTLGALDDRAFYTGTRSATVYAVDRENGSTLWSTWLGATWVNGNVLGHAVSGDTVFAGGWFRTVTTNLPYRAFVVALSRRNGKEIWRYESPPAPTSRAFETPLVLADGTLFPYTTLFRSDRKSVV